MHGGPKAYYASENAIINIIFLPDFTGKLPKIINKPTNMIFAIFKGGEILPLSVVRKTGVYVTLKAIL